MTRYALPVVALIAAPLAFSQESTLEETVVTSSFTTKFRVKMKVPSLSFRATILLKI